MKPISDAFNSLDLPSFAGCGTFLWRAGEDDLYCSDDLSDIFGATDNLTSLSEIKARMPRNDRMALSDQFQRARDTGQAAEETHGFVSQAGETHYLNIRLTSDLNGLEVRGLVVDVTRSHQRGDTLRPTVAEPMPTGSVGLYTHDISQGLSWWSLGTYRMFDMPLKPVINPFEDAQKRIHPDDRAHVVETARAAMARLGTFEMTYRIIRPDGSSRWVFECGETVGPVDPASGLGREVRGALVDITHHRVLREETTLARQAFEDVTGKMPFGLYIVDADLRIRVVSEGARPAFASVDPLVGRGLSEVLHAIWPADFAEDAVAKFRATLATGEAYHSPTATEQRKDMEALESYHWVVQRIVLPDGQPGLMCNFYDLSDRVNRQFDLEVDQAYTEHAIRELQAVIDNSLAFMGVLDDVGVLHEVNAPALIAGGLTRADVVGRPFWEAPWWNYDDAVAQKLKGEIDRVRAGEVVRYDAQVRMQGNSMMTIDFMLSPIVEASGSVSRMVASGFDITERKKAEAHVRLLMEEVNHRSKNVLAVVQSIARMTHRSDPTDFMARFEERLGGLARSYDLLLTDAEKGIGMEDLIRAQLAHFSDLIGSRITLQGPDIRLTRDAAQSLGMAFHELTTNAGKYGALSNATGVITIRWGVSDAGEEGQHFDILWTESGGPVVTQPSRRGFGSTVLCTMVESTLSGTVTLDYPPTGLVWQVKSGPRNIEC